MTQNLHDSRLPADEGFHEIQLTGKQLVFLFMATTVVSVVIFLCGVLVGRGARAEAGVPLDAAALQSGADLPPEFAETPPGAGAEPEVVDEAPVEDDFSYHQRLDGAEAPDESLPVDPPPDPPAPPATASDVPQTTTPTPPNDGLAVQIAALRSRDDAEAIAKRLSGKGYPAYVLDPTPGTPPIYRVRVGTYDSRPEAERVMRRLEREEQFKPWITR